MTLLRALLCWAKNHREIATIRYGWVVVKCQRCGWVRSVEAVRA